MLFPPVPRFGSIPLFLLPLPNELTEAPDTTKEKTQRNHQKQQQHATMGDAASNQPVLAASDLGQSNLDAGAGAGAVGGGGFIALDVSALSSLAGDGPDTTAAPPRTPKVVRSLSRKGERKPADGDGNGAAGQSTYKSHPIKDFITFDINIFRVFYFRLAFVGFFFSIPWRFCNTQFDPDSDRSVTLSQDLASNPS